MNIGGGFVIDGLLFDSLDKLTSGEVTFEIQLEPRDMSKLTPTEIHQKYGWDVATYVIRLRSEIAMWKRIAIDRVSSSAGEEQK